MLKRYQVLLPDWLEDYIIFFSEKYGLSLSELIRAEICISILASVPNAFPDYKSDLSFEGIHKIMDEIEQNGLSKAEVHRVLSALYFEARKAAEFRFEKESQKNK